MAPKKTNNKRSGEQERETATAAKVAKTATGEQGLKAEEDEEAVDYGSKAYWEERYKEKEEATEASDHESTFEWFLNYEDVEPLVSQFLAKKVKKEGLVVDLGCGNSDFLIDMANDGYQCDFLGVDYSENVVKHMNARAKKVESVVRFETMDVTNMKFQDESVSMFVDKSTMDTLLHDDNTGEEMVVKMMKEASRCLAPNGIYVMITQMNPSNNKDFIFLSDTVIPALNDNRSHWEVDIHSQTNEVESEENVSEGEDDEEQGGGLHVYVFKKTRKHSMGLRHGNSTANVQVRHHEY